MVCAIFLKMFRTCGKELKGQTESCYKVGELHLVDIHVLTSANKYM